MAAYQASSRSPARQRCATCGTRASRSSSPHAPFTGCSPSRSRLQHRPARISGLEFALHGIDAREHGADLVARFLINLGIVGLRLQRGLLRLQGLDLRGQGIELALLVEGELARLRAGLRCRRGVLDRGWRRRAPGGVQPKTQPITKTEQIYKD